MHGRKWLHHALLVSLVLVWASELLAQTSARTEEVFLSPAPIWSKDKTISETPKRKWRLITPPNPQQDQGDHRLAFSLRNDSEYGMIIVPTDIVARAEGWVSNSRAFPAHSTAKFCSLVVSGASGTSATTDVISSADDAQRCRVRMVVYLWPQGNPTPTDILGTKVQNKAPVPVRQEMLSVPPEGIVCVGIRLEHQHFLYGDYDPLVGWYRIQLRLGEDLAYEGNVELTEQYKAQAKYTWPAPPEERRDTRHCISAPDSLHLEAHVPGNQYYRFPERPIRYGTKMRLRFWYLIAAGTEGECRARIAQYKDTPTAWKVLTDGAHESCLNIVGRWVKVERVFRTESDATTLALDFRISGADIGEMWIDDVSLEPMGAGPVGP